MNTYASPARLCIQHQVQIPLLNLLSTTRDLGSPGLGSSEVGEELSLGLKELESQLMFKGINMTRLGCLGPTALDILEGLTWT
jgi:hypothetical protein